MGPGRQQQCPHQHKYSDKSQERELVGYKCTLRSYNTGMISHRRDFKMWRKENMRKKKLLENFQSREKHKSTGK
jgi:hypothetical protein